MIVTCSEINKMHHFVNLFFQRSSARFSLIKKFQGFSRGFQGFPGLQKFSRVFQDFQRPYEPCVIVYDPTKYYCISSAIKTSPTCTLGDRLLLELHLNFGRICPVSSAQTQTDLENFKERLSKDIWLRQRGLYII